jgi:hypothetical protein
MNKLVLLVLLSSLSIQPAQAGKLKETAYVVKEVVKLPFRCLVTLIKFPAYALEGNLKDWH